MVREIESKTPYKVVSAECPADTELTGIIVNRSKAVVNFSQIGEVRDAETILSVELVWRDLRTGEVLSRPTHGRPPPGAPPGAPPPPVLVQSPAYFIPELGQSLTSAEKVAIPTSIIPMPASRPATVTGNTSP